MIPKKYFWPETKWSQAIVAEEFRAQLIEQILKKPNILSQLQKNFLAWHQLQTLAEEAKARIKMFCNTTDRSLAQVFSKVLNKSLWKDKFEAIKNLNQSQFTKHEALNVLNLLKNGKKYENIYNIWWFKDNSVNYETFRKFAQKMKKQLDKLWYETTKNLYL